MPEAAQGADLRPRVATGDELVVDLGLTSTRCRTPRDMGRARQTAQRIALDGCASTSLGFNRTTYYKK
jgi:hypothetical protein